MIALMLPAATVQALVRELVHAMHDSPDDDWPSFMRETKTTLTFAPDCIGSVLVEARAYALSRIAVSTSAAQTPPPPAGDIFLSTTPIDPPPPTQAQRVNMRMHAIAAYLEAERMAHFGASDD